MSFRDGLLWLAFPLVWTGLTLVRGAIDGWYPYPFLDPVNGGYGTVAVTVVAITLALRVDRRGHDRDRESREAANRRRRPTEASDRPRRQGC